MSDQKQGRQAKKPHVWWVWFIVGIPLLSIVSGLTMVFLAFKYHDQILVAPEANMRHAAYVVPVSKTKQ